MLPMKAAPRTHDATYRARAIPAGSARYWSWLFASARVRPPLLGIYALLAEWNALMDPSTDRDAALIKLGWWQEEVRRLVSGVPVHPIGVYLKSLPCDTAVDLTPLLRSVDAAALEARGTPLERAADLAPHAQALRAAPLALASRLAAAAVELDQVSLETCTQALAVADYLSRSVADYRREARFGRVPFAVDELMAAGVENTDLTADPAPAHLENYLQQLSEQAARHYAIAAQSLPPSMRAAQRHLLVLAALGHKHLEKRASPTAAHGMRDLFLAWSTAWRATS
jgi:phytoene synthase